MPAVGSIKKIRLMNTAAFPSRLKKGIYLNGRVSRGLFIPNSNPK